MATGVKAFMYAVAFAAASWAGALGTGTALGLHPAITTCVGLLGTAFWFLAAAGSIKTTETNDEDE